MTHIETYTIDRFTRTWRASCSCGWQGPARDSRELARYDYAEHTTTPDYLADGAAARATGTPTRITRIQP
jgi:hypothetical protein